MNFPYNLNEILPLGQRDVVKIGHDLLPVGSSSSGSVGGKTFFVLQQRISEILDAMGAASAKAQSLKGPITSGDKLRMQSEHVVYLLVDRESNAGRGSVVGLLKMGKKNLFLIDRQGEQNEVYPMCVLDFYVHESRQRSGCGKRLYEYMLQDLKVQPRLLAIDRPSPKLVAFMRKHYDLASVIPQVNNYVIYDGFFSNRPFECSPGPKRARIYMGKLQYI